MLNKLLFTSSLLFLSLSNCFAKCEVDYSLTVAPYPIHLTLPVNNPLIIRADAPANEVVNLLDGQYLQSTSNTGRVSLMNCIPNVDTYGNDSVLTPISINSDLTGNYPTMIDGLALRVYNVFNNADGTVQEGAFPGRGDRKITGITGRVDDYGIFMRVKIFKTKEHLNLKNPNGDVLVNMIPQAFYRQYSGSVFWYLDLPQIKIVSTPVCTVTDPGAINFNNVTKGNLDHGVTRNIPFALNCITDYGNYSATASIQATSATPDGNFIKVTDSAGNTDRMKIRIDDTTGQVMKVDGSTSDKQATTISSGTTTNFAWKATLLPVVGASTPELGDFTANAEIVIQVN
jgi:hypothetical protein